MLGLFFALCLMTSSLFIWDIKVVGNEKLTDGEIKRALEECGISSGCFRLNIDNDMVRARMLTKLPELAWMSVNVNGSRATVPVLERRLPTEIYNEKGNSDLVAKSDGIIERIFVRNGKTLVSRGQTVEKGDILVTGTLDSAIAETEYVKALGEVYAHTWREQTAVCPKTTLKKQYKARNYKRYAVMFGKKRINLYFGAGNKVDEYDKIIHNNKIGISGIFTFPVTIVTEVFSPYYPLETVDTEMENMKERLENLVREDVEGEIISIGLVSEVKDNLKKVTVRCECIENIAKEKSGERILRNDREDS